MTRGEVIRTGPHHRVLRHGHHLSATCDTCGDSKGVIDKGLGRAVLAAWETQHQHPENPTTEPTEVTAMTEHPIDLDALEAVVCPCGHLIDLHDSAGCSAYVRPRIGGPGACCTRTPSDVVLDLIERVKVAEAKVARVEAIHRRVTLPEHHKPSPTLDVCDTCWDRERPGFAVWPCATVRAAIATSTDESGPL